MSIQTLLEETPHWHTVLIAPRSIHIHTTRTKVTSMIQFHCVVGPEKNPIKVMIHDDNGDVAEKIKESYFFVKDPKDKMDIDHNNTNSWMRDTHCIAMYCSSAFTGMQEKLLGFPDEIANAFSFSKYPDRKCSVLVQQAHAQTVPIEEYLKHQYFTLHDLSSIMFQIVMFQSWLDRNPETRGTTFPFSSIYIQSNSPFHPHEYDSKTILETNLLEEVKDQFEDFPFPEKPCPNFFYSNSGPSAASQKLFDAGILNAPELEAEFRGRLFTNIFSIPSHTIVKLDTRLFVHPKNVTKDSEFSSAPSMTEIILRIGFCYSKYINSATARKTLIVEKIIPHFKNIKQEADFNMNNSSDKQEKLMKQRLHLAKTREKQAEIESRIQMVSDELDRMEEKCKIFSHFSQLFTRQVISSNLLSNLMSTYDAEKDYIHFDGEKVQEIFAPYARPDIVKSIIESFQKGFRQFDKNSKYVPKHSFGSTFAQGTMASTVNNQTIFPVPYKDGDVNLLVCPIVSYNPMMNSNLSRDNRPTKKIGFRTEDVHSVWMTEELLYHPLFVFLFHVSLENKWVGPISDHTRPYYESVLAQLEQFVEKSRN